MLMLLECQVSLATVLESNPFRMRELFKAEFRIRFKKKAPGFKFQSTATKIQRKTTPGK